MAFFREEKSPREPFLNAPASVLGLIGIILAAHLARTLLTPAVSEQILEDCALIPMRYAASAWAAQGGAPVSIWHAIAPFVGYQFLHADWVHAGVNSVWLLVAGPPVAKRLGAVPFVALFLVCGIIAGLTFVALHWAQLTAAIGASGAVSGMMGAAIRIFYGQRTGAAPDAPPDLISAAPLAPLFGAPILFFSAIWCVANVIAGLTGLGTTGNMQAVAWEAHLGGYFAGLILIGPFDAFPSKKRVTQA
jgi:membrane associated rhomboid family serine protease